MPSIKQIAVLLIISGFIFTGFGYWVLPKIVSQTAVKKATTVSPAQNNTFAAGLEAAYNRLIARGRADVVVPGYGYQVSKAIGGKIKEIKDSQISLEVYPINPLADPALDQRIVKFDAATKIYKRAEKTPEQMKKDFEEFDKKMKASINKPGSEPVMPPEPFSKQEIKLGDLKAGDQIMVTAKGDIHAAEEFTAEEITSQFSGPVNPIKK